MYSTFRLNSDSNTAQAERKRQQAQRKKERKAMQKSRKAIRGLLVEYVVQWTCHCVLAMLWLTGLVVAHWPCCGSLFQENHVHLHSRAHIHFQSHSQFPPPRPLYTYSHLHSPSPSHPTPTLTPTTARCGGAPGSPRPFPSSPIDDLEHVLAKLTLSELEDLSTDMAAKSEGMTTCGSQLFLFAV
jgi:hypothetical protein